ncbi:MAG: NAD(P)-binding protein, partial [Clostridiales bacterium]
MDIRGKEILVVGAGLSGLAVCRFLLHKGAKVLLYDGKAKEKLSGDISGLEKAGCRLLLGNQLPQKVTWQLVVVSPGVPPMIPILTMSREAGLAVIGEMELAFRFAVSPFAAITGTNGKTTTTALTGYIAQHSGINT